MSLLLLLLLLTPNTFISGARLTWQVGVAERGFIWSDFVYLTRSLLLLVLEPELLLLTLATDDGLTWQDGAAEWRRLDGVALAHKDVAAGHLL
jgi:hypothetical protein